MVTHRLANRLGLTGLCLVAVAAMCLGRTSLTPLQLLDGLRPAGGAPPLSATLAPLCLPRVVLAVAVGVALATAGLLMQTVTDNPLATPLVLGIGSGAHLAVLLAMALAPQWGRSGVLLSALLGAAACAVSDIIRRCGSEGMIVNGSADWGISDPLSLPKVIRHMQHDGHDERTIRRLVFENAMALYSQCDRWQPELKMTPVDPREFQR